MTTNWSDEDLQAHLEDEFGKDNGMSGNECEQCGKAVRRRTHVWKSASSLMVCSECLKRIKALQRQEESRPPRLAELRANDQLCEAYPLD